MKQLIKPNKLTPGDLVATVSLSGSSAGRFPARYQHGKKQFEETFGVKIIEMPNSLKTNELYDNPQLRLDDMMTAFKNPEVKAILTNIGGDETIRLLRYMTDEHFEIIRNNPKIFLGMSDTTANHFMLLKAGISSFYSPCTMFGFGENCGIVDITVQSVKKTLFSTEPIGQLPESKEFIVDRVYWDDKNDTWRQRTPTDGNHFIQGTKKVQGRLIGGCMELLTMINGTNIYPSLDEFEDTILFVETSEEMPTPETFSYFLRNLGAMGVLERIKGILFGRPGGDFTADEQDAKKEWLAKYKTFDEKLLKVCKEYGREDMPIVTNMDFGHTVPQIILPYGVLTEIDPANKTVSILENAVI
ncbi:MAG: LD-carboxypeptidase [Alphaproteobacteria bacterium]|nr:LD-carboxypeptidase [Alphaproteobacteria bacterium]